MRFWKNPAHIRTLLLYLLASVAIGFVCFTYDREMGLVTVVVCVMFTILRLIGEQVHDARMRALSRKIEMTLSGEGKPTLPEGKRGALYELDGNVYKLALKLADCEAARKHEREDNDALLQGMAQHLIQRAEELPANVHRRELIALAHDMENLAALRGEPVPQESITPVSAADIWQDAMVMAGETLRLQQITVNVTAGPRAYVTTCPRVMVVNGLRGLLETCARHADVGCSWECTATENPVYTEFRISSDRFDWSAAQLPTLFDSRTGAEPALTYLSRLAAVYSGEVRTERTEGCVSHLIFRLYQAAR